MSKILGTIVAAATVAMIYNMSWASGLTVAVGAATANGAEAFAERSGWTHGAMVQGDLGRSSRWRLVVGALYLRTAGTQASVLTEAGAPSWRVAIHTIPAYAGLRVRISDDAAPVPVFVDVAPSVVFLHFSSSMAPGNSATYATLGVCLGLTVQRAVAERVAVEISARTLVSGSYEDTEKVFSAGRIEGLRQGVFLAGVRVHLP